MKSDTLGSLKQASWQFWLLSAFLALVFLTGGSSRGDVQSLAVLRPAAALVLGVGLLTLRRDDLVRYRWLFIFTVATVASVAIYLIPLPIAENELMGALEAGAGSTGGTSHLAPLAFVPVQAWNSFFSLLIPLAVLLLVVQLNRNDLRRLLVVMLGLSLLSGFVGFLQILGSLQGPLYLYRITNNGTAVGFFANRNHQAVLLAIVFPLLAIFASTGVKSTEQATFRGWVAIAAGIFLIPLILVTGSRAGLVFGSLTVIAALLIYRKPPNLNPPKRKTRAIDWRIPIAGVGILMMGLVTLVLSRAEAVERLFGKNSNEEQRTNFWQPILEMANNSLPLGTGPGSIAETYARIEPVNLIDTTYLNRAHNDWLETYSNFGLLGLVLVVGIVAAAIIRSWTVFSGTPSASREFTFTRLGLVIIVTCALASIVDYPLRTPIMSSVIVIAIVWFCFVPSNSQAVK